VTLDLLKELAEREGEQFDLHERYLNPQLVRVLRTIGFDRRYVRAERQYLFDERGDRYLDLLSGFGVFALGRNHPTVKQALRDVIDADLPNLVQLDVSLLSGLLAERLIARMPGQERIFFCNSGTEATEAAIKLARAATGRTKLVFCEHAFHGLTLGALSLNGDPSFRNGFGPLLENTLRVPFNDSTALDAALSGADVAAFIIEPIQGKGVNLPRSSPGGGYLQDAARLCGKYGTLLVSDEIQTGLGRTGRFLAGEHFGIDPDLVLLAKALSGGFVPIGAVAGKSWIFDRTFNRMDRAVVHGSTFAKNNLAMAAGLATLEVLDAEQLIANADRRGESLLRRLRALVPKYELLTEVRGQGLMIALEFGAPQTFRLRAAWALLDKASRGLFCQMIIIPLFKRHRILSQVAGHELYVIKLLPPLCLSEADEDWVVAAFDAAIAECHNVPSSVWDLATTLAGHALRAKSA